MDVPGYEGLYEVSSIGRVKSFHGRKEYMKPFLNGGYERMQLTKDKVRKKILTHRLVAMAFLPNVYKKPCINHKDGNKLNNRFSNLEWCTIQENNKHSIDNNLKTDKGEDSPRAKLTNSQVLEIVDLYKKGKNKSELSRMFNISRRNIYSILTGLRWNHLTKIKK